MEGLPRFRCSLSYSFFGVQAEGFAASLRWAYGDTPDSGTNASPDQRELDFNFDYYPKEIDEP